uniref:translesion error-prone DNA polymerase V subunit UmuC n=1 Tax=Escherichia coli TaxID=562 RepID=UPI002157F272
LILDGYSESSYSATPRFAAARLPWFQLKTAQFPEPVITFSSNYELYASMSNRVMFHLEELAPRVEQYSIDEMFLDIRGIDRCINFEDFGRQLREHVRSGTGLTIGVGMGPTKTLAKSAQWASKEWPQFRGVLALTPDNPQRTAKLLSLQPVEEIWGVGNRIAKKLKVMGITTALQLSLTSPTFIRKNFSVVLERTVRELNGESCISLEEAPPPKQQIVCSRSFGERITAYESMRQAVCQYAERAAEKLRAERQFCRHIAVFVKTSPFAVNEPYYGNLASEKLLIPTQDTRDIIAAAVKALVRIWVNGHRYAKAGCMLNDFTPSGVSQLNLFDDTQPRSNSNQLMKVVDGINHSGKGKIWFAGRGIAPEWQMKRELLSPAYTTRWADIPAAKLT